MYCFNCMKRLNKQVAFCPHCGKSASEPNAPHQLACGTILNGKYLVGRAIGEGGFGITYVGLDLNLELKIAIKEFFPNGFATRSSSVSNTVTINNSQGGYFNDSKNLFLREAKSLAKFSSEKGIVDVRDYFTENNTTYIVMEYIEGGTLSARLKNKGVFRYDEIFRLMLPIMGSLRKMHAEGLLHRDISPDNIMFASDNSLKLMDFGSARYYKGDQKKTMSVFLKHGYTPFEQHSATGNQGPWTDVYSLCATIYKCITGITPVDSLGRSMNDKLKTPAELGIRVPESFQNILMYGMAIYSDKRCQDMTELMELTQKALSEQNVVIQRPDSTKTQIEREHSTEIAPVPDTPNEQKLFPLEDPFAEEPPKNNKALIAVIITVASIFVVGILAVVAFALSSNNSGSGFGIFATTTAAPTTDPPTEPPTEPTTEPKTEPKTEPPTEPVIHVPNVEGMKSTDAYNIIAESGLKYQTSFEFSNSVPADYVISQSPAEDKKAKEGDTVSLTISRGVVPTEPPTVIVISDGGSGTNDGPFDIYGLRPSSRYLSRSDISWMNKEQIQLAINAIYAKYGLTFTKEPYKSYFGAISSYNPRTKNTDAIEAGMNRYEKENLKVMGTYRDSLK